MAGGGRAGGGCAREVSLELRAVGIPVLGELLAGEDGLPIGGRRGEGLGCGREGARGGRGGVLRRGGVPRLREGEVCHVWPAERAVDGEEAEAGELEAVEVVVHVRDPLVGLFCRAVERRLLVDAMLLRKGNLAEEGEGRRER